MVEAYKNLEEVLEEEIKIYRSLLEIVRKEKEVLVSAEIDELNENNRVKELALSKLKNLEKLREKNARELSAVVGANVESPRLLEIAFKIGQPYSSQLRSIHSTLELLIKRIKDINDANEELIKASLKHVNGALGAIKDTLQPKATYKPTGDIKKGEVAGHFVSKEV